MAAAALEERMLLPCCDSRQAVCSSALKGTVILQAGNQSLNVVSSIAADKEQHFFIGNCGTSWVTWTVCTFLLSLVFTRCNLFKLDPCILAVNSDGAILAEIIKVILVLWKENWVPVRLLLLWLLARYSWRTPRVGARGSWPSHLLAYKQLQEKC